MPWRRSQTLTQLRLACVSLSRTGEGLPVVPGLTRDRWPLGAKSLDPAASDPGLRRYDEYGSIHLTLRTFSVICPSTLQPIAQSQGKTGATQSTARPFAKPKQRGRRGCVSSGGYPHGNACQRRRGRSYDAGCFSPGNLPSQAGSPGRASHRRWRGIITRAERMQVCEPDCPFPDDRRSGRAFKRRGWAPGHSQIPPPAKARAIPDAVPTAWSFASHCGVTSGLAAGWI